MSLLPDTNPRPTLNALIAMSRDRVAELAADRREDLLAAERHRRVREAPIDVACEVPTCR